MCCRKTVLPFLLFLAASAILTVTPPSSALADPVTAGTLSVQDAWARPSIGNAPNGIVYLTITNMGEAPDRLVGASASVAKRVGLHATKMEGGIMKMRPAAQGITVPAKGAIELKPGGFHVMLMGFTRKLVPGQNFDLTLTFERQGAVRIAVEIKPLGYKGSSKSSATMAPHGRAHQ